MRAILRNSPSGPPVDDWKLTRGSDLPDGNSTISIAGGSMRVQGQQTANRQVVLSPDGATDQEGWEIQKRFSDYSLEIIDQTTLTTLYTFPAGQTRAADFIFDAATVSWSLTGHVAIEPA